MNLFVSIKNFFEIGITGFEPKRLKPIFIIRAVQSTTIIFLKKHVSGSEATVFEVLKKLSALKGLACS